MLMPQNKLTPADIESMIIYESYTLLPSGLRTICELMIFNGATYIGESIVIDRRNFVADLGEKAARADAFSKLWEAGGLLMQDRLYRESVDRAGYIPRQVGSLLIETKAPVFAKAIDEPGFGVVDVEQECEVKADSEVAEEVAPTPTEEERVKSYEQRLGRITRNHQVIDATPTKRG